MSVELVIIDLDGTLLRTDQTIGEKTVNAISRAQKQGIKITFATGRMIPASEKYVKMLNIQLPMIALNGALVKKLDGEIPIYHRPLKKDVFERLFPILADSKAATTIVIGDFSFGWNMNHEVRTKLSSWIVGIQDILPEESPQEPTIAMVAGEEIPVRKTYDKIVTLNIPDIQFFLFPSIRYYPMWYLEIRAKGVDKGSGVRALKEKLAISTDNVLVIGDYINDIPMFGEAGIKTTVANAHQKVIDSVDYVSPFSCDQDAVAEIIEKFVLK
ncbi:hypothetical protein DRQ33_03385 [bacterium]|nr:MAG: hypothetical protein DRQ33_03385 [bacterium]